MTPVSRGALSFALILLLIAATARAGIDDLRITEVDPLGDRVEVTHFGTGAFTTSTALPLSHGLGGASEIPPGTTFGPGASLVFDVPGLDDADSDIWLHRDGSLDSASSLLSGAKYGPAAGIGRTALAVTAGIWPSTGAFVPAPAAGQTLLLTTTDPTDPAHWRAGSDGLGAYFGTGQPLDDPIPERIEKGNLSLALVTVVEGLAAPLGLVAPDEGMDRLYVYDQSGVVILVEGGVRRPGFALDVRARLMPLGLFGPGTYDERGLLGFALHPRFAENPRAYTYTSEPVAGPADFSTAVPPPAGASFDHQSVIAEWAVDPETGLLDPASRREILRIDEPQFNHNGGTLRFGPDGYLYATVGDGGGADDEDDTPFIGGPLFGHGPGGNGQNRSTILGSLLRIDVDGRSSANGSYSVPPDNPFVNAPGLDEIWASGFRNPFSFSFDRQTGDLWVADVGQNDIEEVDLVARGDDLGWRHMEGTFYFSSNGTSPGSVKAIPDQPPPPGLRAPVAQYDHDEGLAVIGGYVYRGMAVPELVGRYVFGDFGQFSAPAGRLFYLDEDDRIREFRIGAEDRPLGLWLKGIGEDRAGELYLLASMDLGPAGSSGRVLRIVSLADAPRGPRVDRVSPSKLRPGERRVVKVRGKRLIGVQGVSLGDGITVVGLERDGDGRKLLVEVVVDCDAAPGPRDVLVSTDAGEASRIDGARVDESRPPKVRRLSVRRGAAGETIEGVTILGKRFHDCDTSVVFSDPGVTARNLVVAEDGKSITCDLEIAPGIASGKIDVTVATHGLSHTRRKALAIRAP